MRVCIDPHVYDAGKKIKGRKRHILADTTGLMLHAIVHAADIQDRDGGAVLMATLFGLYPFLLGLYADGGYQGPVIRHFCPLVHMRYAMVGYPFDHRVGRFEESLQIIHGLLRGRRIDFQGRYYQARELELRPRGPRPGGPPILIGARADRPRSLRLTAQYADYWNTTDARKAEDVPSMQQAVDAACVKAGRDPASLQRTAHVLIDLPGSEHSEIPAWVRAHRSRRMLLSGGTAQEMADGLRAFARAGINHIQLWLEPNTMAGLTHFSVCLNYSIAVSDVRRANHWFAAAGLGPSR